MAILWPPQACVLLAAVALTSAFAAGGMGAVKPADPETAALFETDIIKDAVKQSLGGKYAVHVRRLPKLLPPPLDACTCVPWCPTLPLQ